MYRRCPGSCRSAPWQACLHSPRPSGCACQRGTPSSWSTSSCSTASSSVCRARSLRCLRDAPREAGCGGAGHGWVLDAGCEEGPRLRCARELAKCRESPGSDALREQRIRLSFINRMWARASMEACWARAMPRPHGRWRGALSAPLTSLRGGRGAHLVFGERAESGCVGDQATVGEMGCGAQSAAGGVICINSTVAKATGGRTSEQAKALQSARGAAAVLYARRELDQARYAVRVARVTVRTHHLSITH